MITSVKILDNENSLIDYLPELKNFHNNRVFNFKSGINIIIGPNGCGKSTLLNIISKYCLCDKSTSSRLLEDNLNYLDYFDVISNKFKGGVSVSSDFRGKVYKMQENLEDNIEFSFINNNSSTGEVILNSLNLLFKELFSKGDINFPLNEIKRRINSNKENSIWKKHYEDLLDYYLDNMLKDITADNFEFTILMDEPDKNLDVVNLDQVYNILSHRKNKTQLICVIHNPILIYKLSKLSYINFIELENGYLNKVKDLIKKL